MSSALFVRRQCSVTAAEDVKKNCHASRMSQINYSNPSSSLVSFHLRILSLKDVDSEWSHYYKIVAKTADTRHVRVMTLLRRDGLAINKSKRRDIAKSRRTRYDIDVTFGIGGGVITADSNPPTVVSSWRICEW